MIEKILFGISKALLVLASILAFLLCFVVCADVLGRVAFNSPLKGTPELVSSSIVVICYLQASYAILSGGMMHVDAFTAKLPESIRIRLNGVTALLGAALFGLILWGSYDGFINSWLSNEFEGEGALHVPMWPVRLSVVAGTALALCAYLLVAYRYLTGTTPSQALPAGSSH